MLKGFIESISKFLKYESLRFQTRRLTRPGDMPRRIELCQTALAQVTRDSEPEKWAWWQNQLGYSLWQNPLGDRADNLEQAIKHGKQSQKVYTRQAFPEKWASSMSQLARVADDDRHGC